ncbi:MAG TPA: hypothetical protein VHF87_15705 [Methylomirabilota bacterium]|nr:hypothetical protein [Methylomirabilota bacterium]
MVEPETHAGQAIADQSVPRRARSVAHALGQLTLTVVVGLVALGGCAVPFGSGSDSPDPVDPSTREKRRERNRLFLEEQERIERTREFDRVGPSDR